MKLKTVDIQRMSIEEGLPKRYITENLGVRTLVGMVEKLDKHELILTSSDSIYEVTLSHLLKYLPEETRARLETVRTVEDAREAYYNTDAELLEEHVAFAIWLELVTEKDEVSCLLKIAAPDSVQEVLAVRKLATFYQK